jgi:16S rRNA (cytosine967-C5)-methyltransferase
MLAGEVVAVDVSETRVAELRANAARLGRADIVVVHADVRELPPELTGFDRALVDAPCSGLGTLASRPDQRWRGHALPDVQLDLLRAAIERVRAGGTITYAVCTVNRIENQDVVDALGLPFEDLGTDWPRFRHPDRPEFLLTLPSRHRTSGFFVARMRRP